MKKMLITIAVTLVLAGIIHAAQDGTGTNVFESVRIKDGRSVTFGGETRTNWPDGGSFGVTDETAYRGDWGASVSGQVAVLNTNTAPLQSFLLVSNAVENGPILSNANGIGIGKNTTVGGASGIAVGENAYVLGGGVSLGKDCTSGLNAQSIGQGATGANYSVAIGALAKSEFYGVAIGKNSYAAPGAVALGYSVQNPYESTTMIQGSIIIPGGGPTNGAVWIATNTAGMGKWGATAYFRAWITNNFYSSNAVTTYMKWNAPIGEVLYNVGFDGFDGTNLTIKTRGLYESVVCSYWKRAPGSSAQWLLYYCFCDARVIAALELPHSLLTGYGFGSFPSGPILYNKGEKARIACVSPSGSTNYLPISTYNRNFWSFRLVQELPP